MSPQYPLLKRTLGFFGAKQFELEIKPDERPHVVFLFLESFRAADVGVLGGKHAASPEFDRLSREGVLFRNFYGCSVQTTRAVVASLFGILPCFSEKSPQGANRKTPLIGLADLFNGRGYTSAYFSGAPRRFERQGEFFASHGYAEVHCDDELGRFAPQASRTSSGYHDEYLLDYALTWLIEKDRQRQPAFLTLFTITNHHPWKVPEDYRAPQFDCGSNPTYAQFLQTFHYTDHCLGRFMARLREEGLDRRTIVFILADHGVPMGEHHDNYMLVNYLYEEGLRIPLLILAPGRLKKPAVIDDLGSQVDLLPTVMDLFGMTGVNHAVGTSLVRRVQERTVYFNNPFALQYLGLRRGNLKYVETLLSGTSSVYDLEADPHERHDLAAELPEFAAQSRAAAIAVNQLFLHLYLRGRIAQPHSARAATN